MTVARLKRVPCSAATIGTTHFIITVQLTIHAKDILSIPQLRQDSRLCFTTAIQNTTQQQFIQRCHFFTIFTVLCKTNVNTDHYNSIAKLKTEILQLQLIQNFLCSRLNYLV